MLPHSYGAPAAVLLLVGGVLACFAGYRLFKVVLGIYGFILGAMIASSTMGVGNSLGMIVAAIVGGLIGSIVLVLAYFVGVVLVGAGLGALVAHMIWTQFATADPPALAVIGVSVAGAIVAMMLQRYVIIVGTAFGGAWTLIAGAMNAFGPRGIAHGASATEVWILYPTSIGTARWVPLAWVALGLVGTAVQLGLTAKSK